MLRLVWSVILAGLVGGAVAALAVKVFGFVTLTAIAAYPMAVLVGVIVGLLAGKPIWTKGARVEAGLKAAFGALVAAGLMYGLRAWIGFDLDLSAAGLGHGAAGLLPVVAFPSIALVLSLIFEVDNMFGAKDQNNSSIKRVESRGKRVEAVKRNDRTGAVSVVEEELDSDSSVPFQRKR